MESHLLSKQAHKSSVEKIIALVASDSANMTCAICHSNCHENCHCSWTTGLLGNIKRYQKFRSGACSCTHDVFFHKKWSYMYVNDSTAARRIEAETEAQKGKVMKMWSELARLNNKIMTSSSKVKILMKDLIGLKPQNTYPNIIKTEVERIQTFMCRMLDFDERSDLIQRLGEIKRACMYSH